MSTTTTPAAAASGRPGRTVPFGRQGTRWEAAYAAPFLNSNESS